MDTGVTACVRGGGRRLSSRSTWRGDVDQDRDAIIYFRGRPPGLILGGGRARALTRRAPHLAPTTLRHTAAVTPTRHTPRPTLTLPPHGMALCLPGRASPSAPPPLAPRPATLDDGVARRARRRSPTPRRRRLRRLVPRRESRVPLRVVASSVDHPRRTVRTRAVADVADATAEVRTGGYPFEDIEARWQKHWADNKTFRTPEQIDTSKPKFYALDMFPYPRCAAVRRARPRPDRPPSPTLTLNRPVRSSTSLPSRSQRRGSSRGPPRGIHRHRHHRAV